MGKVERVREILRDPFADFEQLTDIERRVVRLASRSITNKGIAIHEQISEEMVAYTLRNALMKMNMSKKDLPGTVFAMIETVVQ